MLAREEQHAAVVMGGDHAQDLAAARETGQSAACPDDVLHLREVLALGEGAPAARPVDIAQAAGVAFHAFKHGFFRQALDELYLRVVLRDRFITCEDLVIVYAHGGTVLAHLFFADGIDDVHAVNIDAEVALNGALCLWLGRDHEAGDLIRFVRYGVDVRRGASHVQDHDVADAAVEDLRRFHDGARSRDDRAADEIADVLHARGFGDVLLERVLDDAAARLDVQLVYLRIYVFDYVKFLT